MFNILNNTIRNSGVESPELDIRGMFVVVLNVVIIIAFGVSFVMFAYSFIQFIMSTGDPKKLEKPKNAMVWSGLGMVIALSLLVIKGVVLRLLGYDEEIFF